MADLAFMAHTVPPRMLVRKETTIKTAKSQKPRQTKLQQSKVSNHKFFIEKNPNTSPFKGNVFPKVFSFVKEIGGCKNK